jgi:ArsR family transcriptional regulator
MDSPLHAYKAKVFQALSHPTRVAIVETLRDDELSAGDLAARLGLEQPNLSQHLAVLRSNQIVTTRRAGNLIYYALRDRVLSQVLDLLKKHFQSRLTETVALLDEIKSEGRRRV